MSIFRVSTPHPRHIGGLDGLRAIAVLLVLIYHLAPKALTGGFLGVDIFFVISGFLITTLLLREVRKSGQIRLVAFWQRRARRLLPPLALVVLVSTTLAYLVDRDLLVNIGKQILGTVFFVSNWMFIANGTDYFTQDTPELFRNTWSLAIEEQFYLVLPLLALLLITLRSRATRGLPLLILGVISAGFMAGMAVDGIDPTRIYFGSDTHSFGLLLGAALAVFAEPRKGTDVARQIGRSGQILTTSIAVLGGAVFLYLAFTVKEASLESFTGGFQLATLLAVAIIWAITRPGAIVGRALDCAPLRWIGERSYGIYLWHWPLLLIVTAALKNVFGGSAPLALVIIITATATFGLAALSYTYVEQPVRRSGIRGAFRLMRLRASRTTRQSIIAIAVLAVVIVSVPMTAVAVAAAPERTSSADVIARGEAMLKQQQAAAEAQAIADAKAAEEAKAAEDARRQTEAPKGKPGAKPTTKDPKGPKKPQPRPAPVPIEVTGADITAVGDSVMLASLPELSARFPGIAVDAAVSRGMSVGADLIEAQAENGTLRSVVLVGLGTNGPVDHDDLARITKAAGNDRFVIFVDAHADRDWIPQVNQDLAAFAAERPGVVTAPWTEMVSGVPDALAGDDIHPNPSGGEIYADAAQQAFDAMLSPGEVRGWSVPRR
ncbi:acetyltransferase [Leucobacter sp. cx-42]|uniref:acyltransferase family protein n=1 Tax=unclassified Leucobacter TaxID=2621730 RepID=UPI00165E3850|nr:MULTISPECIES: acyltransferase family protein [unclassified Leucobacter]MBC9954350.1 acetyltransferase [Leucobacter sp. cx-42]